MLLVIIIYCLSSVSSIPQLAFLNNKFNPDSQELEHAHTEIKYSHI